VSFLVILGVSGAVVAGVVLWSLRLVRSLRAALRAGSSAASGRQMKEVLGAHRRPLAALVVLTLAESALGLASPWPLQVVVDYAIGGRRLPGFLLFLHGIGRPVMASLAAGFGLLLVSALAVVGFAATLLSVAIGESVGVRLRAGLVQRLVHAPLSYVDDNHSGDLVSRLTTDVGRVQDSILARVEVLFPEVVAVVAMAVLMAVLSPFLAAVVLGVVPLLAAVAVVRRRAVAASQRTSRARSGDVSAEASELLRNVRLVRAFGQQARAVERFDRASREAAGATVDASRVSARLSPAADVLLAVDLAAVLVLGTAQVTAHHLSLGELLVFLAYLAGLQGPVRSLSSLASTFGKGAASAERIDDVLLQGGSLAPPLAEPAVAPGRAGPAVVPDAEEPPDVRLEQVSFAYGEGSSVLEDVSLLIEAGTTAVLFGPSGSGKSTLLSLLVRLHDPDEGALLLGGRDLRELDLTTLHRLVALVPQDAWLVAGTIRENVCFGAPGASEDEITWASRLARVDEFVERLPLGWSTEVGEGGVRLSGGQRRRIALARAVLARTPLLLLDEPTAGLDGASRRMIVDAIGSLAVARTIVVATHDAELVSLADALYEVGGGTVRRLEGPSRGRISPHDLHTASTASPSGLGFIAPMRSGIEGR